MLKRLYLIVIVMGLAACGGKSNDSGGEIRSVNESQRTAGPTVTPSPFELVPTRTEPEVEVSSIQLENVPDDLDGHLVLTWGDNLYVVPFDGTPTEPVLQDASLRSVHEHIAIIGLMNADENMQTVSLLNIATRESVDLIELPEDYVVRADKWSPNGQWLTLHIEKQGTMVEYEGTTRYLFEPVDFVLFNTDGEQVDLPITPLDAETRVGAGWLTDNTLLIADGVRQDAIERLVHLDPSTGELKELDISAMSRRNFSFLGYNFYTEDTRDIMNRDLEEYGLELAPVDFEIQLGIPASIAPDNSYSVKIDLQGWGSAGVCGDYYVTQQPIEARFTTRLLHSGQAQRVSDLTLHNENVYYFKIGSPSCEEHDLQVELMRIENFEDPVVETLYVAKPSIELPHGPLYQNKVHDHYLLWSAIEDQNTTLFLTDLNSGDTRILFSKPYYEGQGIPVLYKVLENL